MKYVVTFALALAGTLNLHSQALGLPIHNDAGSVRPEPIMAPSPSIEEIGLRQLLTLKRVYVDRLTGGDTAAQMRDIIISSLQESHLFIVTENQEKADAVIRGAAEDLVFTETHSSSDGINARFNLGSSKGASGYRQDQSAGMGVGDSESDHSSLRRHESIATVRITNKEGDVIWSTTQESLGAKYHGASADVADKIAAKLKEDFERARKTAR
jgi:hypothetical protein